MALDKELNIVDDYELPSKVDGYAERIILNNDAREAKNKKIEENMEKYHRRHAYFQIFLFALVIGGMVFLYKTGCFGMIKDFFESMSQ
jgi:hypothetical protein